MAYLKNVEPYTPSIRPRRPLQAALDPLAEAAKASQPSVPKYNEGLVLYLCWEPNLGIIIGARNQFLKHCSDAWGFTVDSFAVPMNNSASALSEKLEDVKRLYGRREKCLILIVLYGYMAITDTWGRAHWAPHINNATNRILNENYFDWHYIKKWFEVGVRADIAYILDCHFVGMNLQVSNTPPGTVPVPVPSVSHPRIWTDLMAIGGNYQGKEFISSHFWGINKFGLRTGFLTKLINEVFAETKDAPITMAQLYAAVYHKSLELDYRIHPVHLPTHGKRSITLCKLQADGPLAKAAALQLPMQLPMRYDGANANMNRLSQSGRTNGIFSPSSRRPTNALPPRPPTPEDMASLPRIPRPNATGPSNLVLSEGIKEEGKGGSVIVSAEVPLAEDEEDAPMSISSGIQSEVHETEEDKVDWENDSIHEDNQVKDPEAPSNRSLARHVKVEPDNNTDAEDITSHSDSDSSESSIEFILEITETPSTTPATNARPSRSCGREALSSTNVSSRFFYFLFLRHYFCC